MSTRAAPSVAVLGADEAGVLTPESLELVAALEHEFGGRREELLRARWGRQERISAGELPDFLESTRTVRDGDWRVASVPRDLEALMNEAGLILSPSTRARPERVVPRPCSRRP